MQRDVHFCGWLSLPSRGAWIEMLLRVADVSGIESLPSRGAWIEMIYPYYYKDSTLVSLPSRGAWIEIVATLTCVAAAVVAPLTGSVD